jgi:hypothetical protein
MKTIYLKVAIIALSVITASCTVGPYEEPVNLDEPQGPGLFSGAKGEFSLTDYFSDEKKAARQKQNSTDYNVNIPAIDPQSFEDFESFKAWRRAQEPGSANYQEYQDWRAYQQYLRFKAQQGQVQPAEPSTPLK